jgi:hypothetical protein
VVVNYAASWRRWSDAEAGIGLKKKQAAILPRALARSSAVAISRTVVGRNVTVVGVPLFNLAFSIKRGTRTPIRWPHKKGEGDKMTKRRNLLLLSLLVVFGLAATAPSLFAAAGTSWRLSNNENYFARNEGDAEGIGTITLSSLSVGTVAASTYIYIDYNAPIANNSSGYSVSVTFGGDDAATLATCVAVGIETYAADFSVAPIGTLKNNGIVLGFTCPTQSIDTSDTINVVARAMIEGYPNTFEVQGNVRAQYYNTNYPLTLSSNYPQNLNLAEIEGGESAPYTTATATTFYFGPENVLTCIGVYGTGEASVFNEFTLNIMENWPNALTSLSDEYSLEHDTVTTMAASLAGVAGAPTNGSNILITFFHIPPTVVMNAASPVPCQSLSPSDSFYCPGGNINISAATVGTESTGSDGLGVQWFWYQTETTNVGVIESVNFPFYLSSTGPIAVGQKYQITAQISLTDGYPVDGSSSQSSSGEMPYFTLPEGGPFPVVNFIDCRTNLLFPYINSYQGGTAAFSSFGTGINVANTTVDPFALPTATCVASTGQGCTYPDEAPGSAVPQSGSCAFYFYPANEAPYTLYTTPTISAGGSFAFDVGATAKWQAQTGYAIAICGFQNAHGFAEIYDNYVNMATTGPTATLGYLADVLPDPAFYPRSPAGDLLGETAIAPIPVYYYFGTSRVNRTGATKSQRSVQPAARKH